MLLLFHIRCGVRGHSDEVLDVSFDSTGQRLVTASSDGEVAVLVRQLLLFTDCGSRYGMCLQCHYTECCVQAAGSHRGDLQGNRLSPLTQCICSFLPQVTFNPQGSRILTASSDKTARLWDPSTGKCLQVSSPSSSLLSPSSLSLLSPPPCPPPLLCRHWAAIQRRCLVVCSITKETKLSQLGRITRAASGDNL